MTTTPILYTTVSEPLVGVRSPGDRTAEPPFLLTSRASLHFNPDSDAWLDVAAFTELLAAGEHHVHLTRKL